MLFLQCIIFCILFFLLIIPAQYKNPMIMIASYPPKVKERVKQLPQYKHLFQQQNRSHLTKKMIGFLFLVLLLAVLARLSGCRNFLSAFLHVFILMMSVNLFDLIVMDWGIFCHSKRLRIPGTEDMEAAYRDHLFHLKGAFKGTVLSLIMALLSGSFLLFFP